MPHGAQYSDHGRAKFWMSGFLPNQTIHLQSLNVCPGCDRHTLFSLSQMLPELSTAYPGRGLIWINLFRIRYPLT